MADFNAAYDITMGHEGGYANDPDDRGGETFKGIARNFWPDWQGWEIIDRAKGRFDFPEVISNNAVLDGLVRSFYKKNFWSVFGLDDIENQDVANELFDTSINVGVKRAATFLQRAVNALNRDEKDYSNITVDGAPGSGTRAALQDCMSSSGGKYLLKVLNALQGEFYVSLMEKNESQEKYLGWFNRI